MPIIYYLRAMPKYTYSKISSTTDPYEYHEQLEITEIYNFVTIFGDTYEVDEDEDCPDYLLTF